MNDRRDRYTRGFTSLGEFVQVRSERCTCAGRTMTGPAWSGGHDGKDVNAMPNGAWRTKCDKGKGRAFLEDPDKLCCSECGGYGFDMVKEEDEWR